MDVPLDNDSTSSRTTGGEDHVRDLDDTSGSGSANLDDRPGVVVIGELGARAHDLRPDLSDDLGAHRDGDGGGDDVGTSIKEDDLAASVLRENVLDRLGIVRVAVTLCALRADADEVAGGVACVLRVGLADDAASTVE